MDIADLEHNVRDGVHMGSLAGAWLAAVHGLGGMRHHGESLSFSPRLPPGLRRLAFRVTFLGRLLRVAFDHDRVTYRLLEGRPMTFTHDGEPVRVARGKDAVRAMPHVSAVPAPKQPPGRTPARRTRQQSPRKLRPSTKAQRRRPKPAATGGKAA